MPLVPKIGIFVGPSRLSGGSFQYCLGLLEACAKIKCDDFEFVVASTSKEWSNHAERLGFQALKVTGSPIVRRVHRIFLQLHFPLSTFRKCLYRFSWSSRKMVDQNCDFWIFPSPSEISLLLPVRAIVAIHDLMHRYEKRFPEVGNWRERRARERLFSNICKYSTAILVDSNCGHGHVVRSYGVPQEKVFIQPFLPPDYIYQHQSDRKHPKKYRLPEKYFFYPSQFWPHKNHSRLLHAFARLKRQSPDVSLVLSGALQLDYKKLKQLTEALDLASSVYFIGYVRDDDIPGLYRGARALIYPSFFGPTNIPPLEAFALGCPVAAADVYGMKEQLGDAALFFDPESERQIAKTMSVLWNDDSLCELLAKRGLSRSELWTPNDFTSRLEEHLRSIIVST